MQQISPRRPIDYTVTHEDFPGVIVQIKPLTEPQRAKLMGQLGQSGANWGSIAVEWCTGHVVGWSGLPVEFRRRGELDDFPAEIMVEVVAALATGSRLTEADAGN